MSLEFVQVLIYFFRTLHRIISSSTSTSHKNLDFLGTETSTRKKNQLNTTTTSKRMKTVYVFVSYIGYPTIYPCIAAAQKRHTSTK